MSEFRTENSRDAADTPATSEALAGALAEPASDAAIASTEAEPSVDEGIGPGAEIGAEEKGGNALTVPADEAPKEWKAEPSAEPMVVVSAVGSDAGKGEKPEGTVRPVRLRESAEVFGPVVATAPAEATRIQSMKPATQSFAARVSEHQRREADVWSTWGVPPVHNPRGLEGLGQAFVERRQNNAKASETAPDQADQADQANQSATAETTETVEDENTSTIWAYTSNGLDAASVLASARRAEGPDGNIVCNTKLVLAFDNPAQEQAVRRVEAELFPGVGEVQYQQIDPRQPNQWNIPEKTHLVLLDDRLAEQPAHQISTMSNGDRTEYLERTDFVGKEPILVIDTSTGEARALSPELMSATQYGIGDGSTGTAIDLLPRLAGGRMSVSQIRINLDRQGANDMHTDLQRREEDFGEFMQGRPAGTTYNYSDYTPAMAKAATAGVMETGGLVYISGPQRNGLNSPANSLPPTALTRVEGPLRRSVIESAAVAAGAYAADPQAACLQIGYGPGHEGYLLIDRAAGNADGTRALQERFLQSINTTPDQLQVEATVAASRNALENATTTSEIVQAADNLDTAITALQQAEPWRDRDYTLLQTSAQLLNDQSIALSTAPNAGAERSDAARRLAVQAERYAQQASDIAPHLSGPQVEIMAAKFQQGDIGGAGLALQQAHDLNPRNPRMYAMSAQAMSSGPGARLAELYPAFYARTLADHIQHSPEMSTEQVVDCLMEICQALEADWRQTTEGNKPQGAKTIVREDLVTGEFLPPQTISMSEWKRIRVAQAYLTNGQTVEMLLATSDMSAQAIDKIVGNFYHGLRRTTPLGEDGRPSPRSEWTDRPQGQRYRWHHAGTLAESDTEAIPTELLEWADQQRELWEDRVAEAAEEAAARVRLRPDLPQDTEISIGRLTDIKGDPTAFPFAIPIRALRGTVHITGPTGSGKTTIAINLLKQADDELGANFWVIDAGNKADLSDRVVALNNEGRAVGLIAPGDPNCVPVSFKILKPEGCDIDTHIGSLTDFWVTVYGGGEDTPVIPVLKWALNDVYARNGWPVTPPEDGQVLPAAVVAEPRVPTLSELKVACMARAANYVGDMRNIVEYFKERLEALGAGALGEAMEGDNELDMEAALAMNLAVKLNRVTDTDERRALVTGLLMQAGNHIRYVQGLKPGLERIIAVDEVSAIARRPGPHEQLRQKSVEKFTDLVRQVAAYATCVMTLDQSAEFIDPLLISQAGTFVAAGVSAPNDQAIVIPRLGTTPENAEEYRQVAARLTKGGKGKAEIWHQGMAKGKSVLAPDQPLPTAEELALAMLNAPLPPLVTTGIDLPKRAERIKALQEASSTRWSALRLYLAEITMAHFGTELELPRQVPAGLQAIWHQIVQEDPRAAKFLLQATAQKVVKDRAKGFGTLFPPERVARSVSSYAAGLLNGTPAAAAGSHITSGFIVPSVAITQALNGLANRAFDRIPGDASIAWPVAHSSMVGAQSYRNQHHLSSDTHQRARDLIMGLKRLPASPGRQHQDDEQSTHLEVVEALVGSNQGHLLWGDLDRVVNESHKLKLRRIWAAELGQEMNYPARSQTELLLQLGNYAGLLHKEAAAQRAAEKAKEQAGQ